MDGLLTANHQLEERLSAALKELEKTQEKLEETEIDLVGARAGITQMMRDRAVLPASALVSEPSCQLSRCTFSGHSPAGYGLGDQPLVLAVERDVVQLTPRSGEDRRIWRSTRRRNS
ncbi:hypothetical protein P3T27_007239 [Kitasatospora sp. MAA19]|uniref:hypothetical protein n=1 Tax=Kitasatospora sp. MAA19 TaxID=3035090 RepID=UPI002475C11F|nr:hypothetical protein [Kitasatospora sp. MAA19]MDH6710489.1 hypothetical protein [Kitasatospora sp. MAA19]